MFMIEAEYRQHLDENLNNNPLTEALRVELQKNDFIRKITINSNIQSNFWSLPMIYQTTQLRQLTDVHIPLPQTWNMYNKFIGLILYSYSQRNPFSRDTMLLRTEIADRLRNGTFERGIPVGLTTAPSVLVSGDSGTGKTTTIRTVLRQIPQVIQHTSYKGKHFVTKQLTWISFDLPPNGAPKAMAANFFRAVDMALGTSYATEWDARQKESVDKHLSGMQQVAVEHNLGMAHVDELQFMLAYIKSPNSPSLQILESLFNKIGVPIVQSCTAEGVALFDTLVIGDHRIGADMTTVRRMLNDRAFKFLNHDIESDYFIQLFDTLFPEGLINAGRGSDRVTFRNKFHELSCGLPAIMIRLALLHHETLVNLLSKPEIQSKNYHTYDVALLVRVYKNQFSLIDPALVQYRRGNKQAYESTIRAETNNTKYSNGEAKDQRREVADIAPKVIKSIDSPNPMLSVSDRPMVGDFLQGFGDDVDG
ncbi:AAA family ATPase [Amphritea sp.]|uniref:AAA family ATPase n=1 Tax=Amphritea sp. TaxID=1872502 RepID=UPI003A90BC95